MYGTDDDELEIHPSMFQPKGPKLKPTIEAKKILLAKKIESGLFVHHFTKIKNDTGMVVRSIVQKLKNGPLPVTMEHIESTGKGHIFYEAGLTKIQLKYQGTLPIPLNYFISFMLKIEMN